MKLQNQANQAIAQFTQKEKITIAFAETRSGDLKIHYLAVPFVTPAWTIKDGNLYVGLYPQVVAGAARHVGNKGESILKNPQFAALRTRLGGQKATGVQFIDLPRTAPSAYQELLMVSRLYLGMADMFGVQSPAMLLPPLNEIMPHLAPAGAITFVDADGWHAASVSPFPGSSSFYGSGMGAAGVGQQAMLVSIMLPAMNRAREQGNRVKSASNLRQIGLAIQLHANDNKGRYPAEIGQLADQDLTPDVFVNPRGSGGAPPRGLQGEAIKQWIRQNSDYEYIGAGRDFRAAADVVIAYEKPEGLTDGINLLYADGHVEFHFMPLAMEQIEKSRQGAKLPRDPGGL